MAGYKRKRTYRPKRYAVRKRSYKRARTPYKARAARKRYSGNMSFRKEDRERKRMSTLPRMLKTVSKVIDNGRKNPHKDMGRISRKPYVEPTRKNTDSQPRRLNQAEYDAVLANNSRYANQDSFFNSDWNPFKGRPDEYKKLVDTVGNDAETFSGLMASAVSMLPGMGAGVRAGRALASPLTNGSKVISKFLPTAVKQAVGGTRGIRRYLDVINNWAGAGQKLIQKVTTPLSTGVKKILSPIVDRLPKVATNFESPFVRTVKGGNGNLVATFSVKDVPSVTPSRVIPPRTLQSAYNTNIQNASTNVTRQRLGATNTRGRVASDGVDRALVNGDLIGGTRVNAGKDIVAPNLVKMTRKAAAQLETLAQTKARLGKL